MRQRPAIATIRRNEQSIRTRNRDRDLNMQQDRNFSSMTACGRNSALAVALAAALAALSPGNAAAQSATVAQRSFINLSFEVPDLVNPGCRVYIDQSFVPGWTTNHPLWNQETSGTCTVPSGFTPGVQGNIIELWHTPRTNGGLTVNARSGTQLAELNAEALSRLSQNVCLVTGDEVRWQFSHRGRASPTVQDRMQFLVGSTPIVEVGTTNDGSGGVLNAYGNTATSVLGPNSWRDYSGSFTYTGAGGTTNIGFEALSGSATTGNFLDDIQVFLKPFIEFTGASPETVEGTSDGLPALSVVGTLENALVVNVSVTGGTAVLGTDFTTPGGGANFTVNVPAGTYDGSTTIPLGLTAIGNGIVDGSRTVELTLEPSPDDYLMSSTSECGASAIAQATWTLLDDDLDLSIVKTANPTTAVVGDTVNYTLTVTHDEGVDGDGAVVKDPAVAGLDCSASVVTCTSTNGAVCPASPTIAALQGSSGLTIPTLPAGGSIVLSYACTVNNP
ncbi:MAG: hypothetical protein QM761_13155 [Pseudoxanthomonas sp.]